MSAEKIILTEVNNLPLQTIPENSEATIPENSEAVLSSGRVDINILLNRARKTREKETLKNLVITVTALSLIVIFGIILSF